MSLPRRAARAMLAGIFISGGVDQLRNPRHPADRAEPVIAPLAERIGPLPRDPEQVVKLDGAIKIAAGLGMVAGPFARPSALVLAGSLVPTTLAGHRFWERQDPQQRAAEKVHFLKNVSMLGGLLIAALDTGGRAVGGAVTDVAGAVGSGVAHGAGAAAETVGKVGKVAGKTTGRASKLAAKSTGRASKLAAKSTGRASKLAAKSTGRASTLAARSSAKAGKVAGKASTLAAKTGAVAGEAAGTATGAAKTVGKTVGAVLPG
jgi:putative oxidoreductase